MKRNQRLLSATAAACLGWPLAGVAEPRADQPQSSERQVEQPRAPRLRRRPCDLGGMTRRRRDAGRGSILEIGCGHQGRGHRRRRLAGRRIDQCASSDRDDDDGRGDHPGWAVVAAGPLEPAIDGGGIDRTIDLRRRLWGPNRWLSG